MRYAINMNDGSVAIMEIAKEFSHLTPDDCIKQWGQEKQAKVISVSLIQDSDIPVDRSYRNAWTWKGKIEHDMVKARNIHRGKIREARKPKLESLDVSYQRADETRNTLLKSQIAAQKQVLRDLTAIPEIEAAATVEQLKMVWPEVLK